MTWGEFITEVTKFLDVDGKRRGIEELRVVFTRAAVADLKNYIDGYQDGVMQYAPADQTPFTSETAEAVAEFIKSRLTMRLDRDLQLSQAHYQQYTNIRRKLFLRDRDGHAAFPVAEFVIQQGDTIPVFEVTLLDENNQPVDLTNATLVQFVRTNDDSGCVLTKDATITDVQGKVRYEWGTTDNDVRGNYTVKFRVTFGVDGVDGIRTYPTRGGIPMLIE